MKIYVAGPLTSSGTLSQNVRSACLLADELIKLGCTPFIPHLSVFWEMVSEEASRRTHEEWMNWCLPWVKTCDGLYRLPGFSQGSISEELTMKELKRPIFYSISEVMAYLEKQNA